MTQQTNTCNGCGEPFTFEVGDSPLGRRLAAVRGRCDGCVQLDRDRDEEERAARERLNDAQELTRRLKAAGLPRRLPDTIEDQSGEAWHYARQWATGKLESLFLFGPLGTGKTTMAACALRARLRRRPGFWRSVPVLVNQLGAGFDNPQHDQALALLDGTYMLGLDDLDKGRSSAFVGEKVFAAIDGCYANRTPLIVTSNVALDTLAEHWAGHGEAIASRLSEGTQVLVDGDDRRLR
jgi:DNA replication protein DnaC